MPKRTLHVNISSEAVAFLDASSRGRNRAGRSLRDWLVRSFLASETDLPSQTSFFGTTIEVDDDVPLLLEAAGRRTKRNPNDLVEAWALEAPSEYGTANSTDMPLQIPSEVGGKLAELLDLGETLFEETVADARRKLRSYPEGEKAAQAGAQIFTGLRVLLGLLPDSESEANKKEPVDRS